MRSLPSLLRPVLVPLVISAWAFGGDEGYRPLLEAAGEVEAIELEELDSPQRLESLDLLVWDTRSRVLPAEATAPETVEAVREWVEGGGRLLLFSHALQWACDLGFEPVEPDRRDTKLLGYRDQYSQGMYVYGVAAADPEHPLFRGLEPYGERSGVFLLAGGHAVRNESCFWESGAPEKAEVLATFYRHGYGEDRGFAHRALVALAPGRGRVLAFGCGPLVTTGNPRHANLARFVANAVRWLCDVPEGAATRPRIGLLPAFPAQLGVDEYSSPPPPPEAAPWPEDLVGPRLPYLAHWGWHGQIDYQRGGKESVDLDYFRERIVDESAVWGANLLEFYPPDMQQGYPFTWDEDDPIPRPERYWGGGFDPLWNLERAHELVRYAQSRGFLVHTFNHPNPVHGDLDVHVVYAEHTARDFANPLLYGSDAALDGFGVEWFPSDREGLITAALWKYNPGAYQHSTAILPAFTPNFSGTLMCAFGRLGSLNACGFSDQWRHVFHPPLYLSYQADCRTRKPSRRDWGGWAYYGGGSYPDWILRQVNGFCRERLELDSAIWWLGEPESTLDPRYREYVYGISMDPIRCAVACELWATGRGGYRQTIAELSPDPPPGFTAGADEPFDAAIVQNDFLRIVRRSDRVGGKLLYDPLHLARFDPDVNGDARGFVLFDDLLAESELPGEPIDELVFLLGTEDGRAEGGASGGYESDCLADAESFPSRIAYEATPEWPERLRLRFTSKIGRHRLRIGVLEADAPGLVEVFLDGEPIGFYSTGARSAFTRVEGEPVELEFPVLDAGREHELAVQVQSGAGHALDFLELRRVRTGAVAQSVALAAGAKAELVEHLVRNEAGGAVVESRRFTLRADDPVLDVRFETQDQGATRVDALAERFASLDLASWETSERGWLRYDESAGCWIALGLLDGEEGIGCSLGVFASRERAAELLEDPAAGLGRVVETTARPRDGASYPFLLVRERDAGGRAWWTARGAQQLGETCLVRVHDRPGARGVVSDSEYLPSGFRPGRGCQRLLAIESSERRGAARVRVAKVGPFVFAPRVEFDGTPSSVRLDGEDWRYFEGSTVFLPNRVGEYDVEIETDGPAAPGLAATSLTVTGCRWIESEKVLRITTSAPDRSPGPLPGELGYTALVLTRGHHLLEARGAEPIPLESYRFRTEDDRRTVAERGLVLRLAPGTATLRFE